MRRLCERDMGSMGKYLGGCAGNAFLTRDGMFFWEEESSAGRVYSHGVGGSLCDALDFLE